MRIGLAQVVPRHMTAPPQWIGPQFDDLSKCVVPRDQARVFKETLPDCQSGQRNRCGLHIIERSWFGSQFTRGVNGVVSFGASYFPPPGR